MMIRPIILAGGMGTRLWPLSRQSYPKQFLRLVDAQHSLLQQTALRLSAIKKVSVAPLVICNQQHYFICSDQLKAINIDADYILEPIARNTAPAIAVAAFSELAHEVDPYFLIMPADHLIKDMVGFNQAIELAMQPALADHLVTFSIIPTQPETGYGYIERGEVLYSAGVYNVANFIEKPDLMRAEQLLSTGNHYWNSGMFIFKASTYLRELKHYAPDIYEFAERAFQQGVKQEHVLRLEHTSFSQCPNESIDYAVMEKTKQAATIPLSVGWTDLGCWNAISTANEADNNNNVIQGDVLAYNTQDCFINAGDKFVATMGLKDHIIVSTQDSVLVAHKSYTQSVKALVQELQKNHPKEVESHTKVYRPWGYYESLLLTLHFQVKQVVVNPGGRLSLQLHHHRSEHWVVVEGVADVVCGEENMQLTAGQYAFIPVKTKHRLSNTGTTPLVVIETQLGHYLGEDDIVRFEDIYIR